MFFSLPYFFLGSGEYEITSPHPQNLAPTQRKGEESDSAAIISIPSSTLRQKQCRSLDDEERQVKDSGVETGSSTTLYEDQMQPTQVRDLNLR